MEKGRKRKREERREKRKAGFLLSHSFHPFIHISMHGCHAYYCRDDFKHDDQRKSHSAPH